MIILTNIKVELKRLLQQKTTWIVFLITILSPLLGILFYHPIASFSETAYSNSINSTWIGNPSIAAAVVGSITFGIMSIYEHSRIKRKRIEMLIQSIGSLRTYGNIRTFVIGLFGIFTSITTMILWYPYLRMKVGNVFSLYNYYSCFILITTGAIIFAVLAASTFYHLTQRMDASLALFTVFVMYSLTLCTNAWLKPWIFPSISYIHDDFGNYRLYMSIAYNRLFWLLVLLAAYHFSSLCIRIYQYNVLRSIVRNLKHIFYPVVAILCMVAGVYTYMKQPFLDHSDVKSEMFFFPEYEEYQDGLSYDFVKLNMKPNVNNGTYYCEAEYAITNTTGSEQTLYVMVNSGYHFQSVKANGVELSSHEMKEHRMARKVITVKIPNEPKINLTIQSGGFPQEWCALSEPQGEDEISNKSVMISNENALPILLNCIPNYDMDSMLDAIVDLPKGMTPVVFGSASVKKIGEKKDTFTWSIENSHPNIQLFATDYTCEKIEASGLNVDFYYSQNHKAVLEKYHSKDAIKQTIEYCMKQYGPLDYLRSNQLKLITIGIIGGGYAGDSTSVFSEDTFGEKNLSDQSKGVGGSEVLTHEIVHQWWGLSCGFDEDDNGWSSEGLTVYTTYRIMKDLYGEDYVNENYIKKWKQSVHDYFDQFYVRNPKYLEMLPEKYQSQIVNSASEMLKYCKMPLMIHKAEQLVGGEEKFDEILYGIMNREINSEEDYYISFDYFVKACGLTPEDLELNKEDLIIE